MLLSAPPSSGRVRSFAAPRSSRDAAHSGAGPAPRYRGAAAAPRRPNPSRHRRSASTRENAGARGTYPRTPRAPPPCGTRAPRLPPRSTTVPICVKNMRLSGSTARRLQQDTREPARTRPTSHPCTRPSPAARAPANRPRRPAHQIPRLKRRHLKQPQPRVRRDQDHPPQPPRTRRLLPPTPAPEPQTVARRRRRPREPALRPREHASRSIASSASSRDVERPEPPVRPPRPRPEPPVTLHDQARHPAPPRNSRTYRTATTGPGARSATRAPRVTQQPPAMADRNRIRPDRRDRIHRVPPRHRPPEVPRDPRHRGSAPSPDAPRAPRNRIRPCAVLGPTPHAPATPESSASAERPATSASGARSGQLRPAHTTTRPDRPRRSSWNRPRERVARQRLRPARHLRRRPRQRPPRLLRRRHHRVRRHPVPVQQRAAARLRAHELKQPLLHQLPHVVGHDAQRRPVHRSTSAPPTARSQGRSATSPGSRPPRAPQGSRSSSDATRPPPARASPAPAASA
jgi:hypothetical protein